ncbi:MAG TPA: type IV pilus modification protein PilV [Nevskiaceae bacterium]
MPLIGARAQLQAGIGLIEILVAVLVLSIGILGIAALQTRALVSSGNSMGRSMATVATYSIVDAMLADRNNAVNSAYNGTVQANECPEAGSLAQTQLEHWCQSLGETLGAAATTKGTINCDGNGNCTITITWDDSRLQGNPTPGGVQTLQTRAQI